MVREDGLPSGPAILSIHGTGMGRTLYGPHLTDVRARGARAIAYDRPGLGGSTRRPGYAIADTASDVRTIAHALGIEQLVVWGASAGGMPALACGALAPDLVAAVALFAPATHRTVDTWVDQEAKRAEFTARAAEDRVRPVESWIEVLSDGVPPADVEAVRTGDAEWYATDAADAMQQGGDGWFDEGWAMRKDWGFRPEDVSIPVLIIHGKRDVWIDPAGSIDLARRIPGAELRLTENDGHLSVMRNVPTVNEWLLARLAEVAIA